MEDKIWVKVLFRKTKDLEFACESCEERQAQYYSEELCEGWCENCMIDSFKELRGNNDGQ